MLPRTPQKKNSLALDSKVEPMMSNFYKYSDHS